MYAGWERPEVTVVSQMTVCVEALYEMKRTGRYSICDTVLSRYLADVKREEDEVYAGV